MKNKIEEKRKALGLTQFQLAQQLGVSRQTIISLENGRYNPSLTLAYELSRVFQTTIEDIFIFEEDAQ